jgi:hypothetical protein
MAETTERNEPAGDSKNDPRADQQKDQGESPGNIDRLGPKPI